MLGSCYRIPKTGSHKILLGLFMRGLLECLSGMYLQLFFIVLQMDQFVILDMALAFSLDGLANSHPIKVPVNHPDEINEIFDSISYNKVCYYIAVFLIQLCLGMHAVHLPACDVYFKIYISYSFLFHFDRSPDFD